MRGFHSDNGSEFINHTVSKLLNKLLIEQTKSRPRHSNDNGLAESKNGAVVRKHMGYGYIAAPHAAAIEMFYEQHFNPYLNFHRPCGVPESEMDAKGKVKKNIPLVCDAVGDPTPTSGSGAATEARCSQWWIWIGEHEPRRTPKRPWRCKKPSESCSPSS